VKFLVSLVGLAVLVVGLLLASPGVSQAPTPIPSVWLQSASPGTAQTGNIRIGGAYTGAVSGTNSVAVSLTTTGDNSRGIVALSYGTNSNAIYGSGAFVGVHGAGQYGVFGNSSTGIGIGVYGQGSYRGVSGQVLGAGNAGVYGEHGSDGPGVRGRAWGSSGVGVLGQGNTGVRGEGDQSDGVYGTTGSGSAAGVSGQNTGSGFGVYASSVSGYGIQASAGGFAAVFGSGSVNGVYGLSWNNGASGVYGVNNGTGWGVYGTVGTSGTAVAGVNPDPAGYGMYCHGRLTATGTKLFQIDHPFDPENKYLNHFCTEGAEPLNVYSSTVRTDDKGYATVALPDYFAEINRDPRVQLTVVDDSDDFVFAKVTRKVEGCQFTLRTSKPNVEVFWRVEAVRNDNWVRTHGFAAEEEKPAARKGTYVNPEFYGKSKELGQSYVPPPPSRKGSAR